MNPPNPTSFTGGSRNASTTTSTNNTNATNININITITNNITNNFMTPLAPPTMTSLERPYASPTAIPQHPITTSNATPKTSSTPPLGTLPPNVLGTTTATPKLPLPPQQGLFKTRSGVASSSSSSAPLSTPPSSGFNWSSLDAQQRANMLSSIQQFNNSVGSPILSALLSQINGLQQQNETLKKLTKKQEDELEALSKQCNEIAQQIIEDCGSTVEAINEELVRIAYKNAFNNTDIGIAIVDPWDQVPLFMNAALEKFFGFTKSELSDNIKWRRLVREEDLAAVKKSPYLISSQQQQGSTSTTNNNNEQQWLSLEHQQMHGGGTNNATNSSNNNNGNEPSRRSKREHDSFYFEFLNSDATSCSFDFPFVDRYGNPVHTRLNLSVVRHPQTRRALLLICHLLRLDTLQEGECQVNRSYHS